MSDWTDELKEEVVSAYLEQNPTPENTTEIVKSVAEQFEKTPNGVRMVLIRANAYVKQDAPKSTGSSSSSSGAKRVNKAEAIDSLKKVIAAAGKDVDDDICDRLTGKAAVYITGLLQ